MGYYKSGNLEISEPQGESSIDKSVWLKLNQIDLSQIVEDEVPAFRAFDEYKSKNPFQLTSFSK